MIEWVLRGKPVGEERQPSPKPSYGTVRRLPPCAMTKLLKYLLRECPSYEVRAIFATLIGRRSAREIADETGINPTNVYRVIEALRSKGIRDIPGMAEALSLEIKGGGEIISGDNSVKNRAVPRNTVAKPTSKGKLSVEIIRKKAAGEAIICRDNPRLAAIKEKIRSANGSDSSSNTTATVKSITVDSQKLTTTDSARLPSVISARPGRGDAKYARPSQEDCEDFFERMGSTREVGKDFFLYWEALDWISGKTKIAYWKMKARLRIAQLQGTPGFKAAAALKPKQAWQVREDDRVIRSLIDERRQLINKYRLPSQDRHHASQMFRVREIQQRLDSLGVRYENRI